MARRIPEAGRKPLPPHEIRRSVDLPGCAPKPRHEDLKAPDLVQRIMAAPNYRRADEDMDFLHRDAMRGTRLLLDYQKAETLLEEHGIAHAIVVFGATRIGEPGHAAAKVAAAEAALGRRPGDPELERQLAVARRLEAKSGHYETRPSSAALRPVTGPVSPVRRSSLSSWKTIGTPSRLGWMSSSIP